MPAPAPARQPHFAQARAGLRAFYTRHEKALLVASSVLFSALLFVAYTLATPPAREITQRDIDAAVRHTLEKSPLPSPESKAFERIRRSVVRVVQVEQEPGTGKKSARGVGSGVVIIDKGAILTSLHVVEGDENTRIKVQFANGMESDAIVLRRMPDQDLAVIEANTVPDDLVPATLRSTQGLATGDRVVAVGFPFNIGPSASSGIISGLKRTYAAPDGSEVLNNLIQFDAAANPGNSGGPLVTMEGDVVGIVTAILSPHEQGTFIGIGFAVPIEIAAAAAGESPF
ncbi:MAG TPA: trypsin-like peptidase domain-containing protein [Noviherbaspirillum sp.]|uniref:S1C family serine protease n=1 Tax=Noviherbaspirillum sp. TaxID=1926288 RepID=UPI002B47FCA5|nr:trypsin-like peptidase domain-containing protein [Noviherbaspirillum sp.]HJV85269.1 trypsin-like peptidase domain-containing protein [Noviherbaspirillum sp.]